MSNQKNERKILPKTLLKSNQKIIIYIFSYLNKLTLDTYDETKKNIFNLVNKSVDHQEKLIDVLFQKVR